MQDDRVGQDGSGPAVVRVAVPSPLRRAFDYWAPPGPVRLAPGVRVRVPFGRSQRIAVVLSIERHSNIDPERLKPVLEVLDAEPVLGAETIALLSWASAYYHHPIGEVFQTALPALLRRGAPASGTPARGWRCTPAGASVDPSTLDRAPRQRELLALLQGTDGAMAEGSLRLGTDWRRTLARLAQRGWIAQTLLAPADEALVPTAPTSPVTLNHSQRAAVERVRESLGRFGTFVLDGVTGSGKTEVYLSLVAEVAANGGQALVLVPEIGLTPQTLERFRQRLGLPVAMLHSGMSDAERLGAWDRAARGRVPVVLGTRSAVFVPLRQPALFVVDEEHDLSFKQQEGFRYSARDLAVVRAREAGAPVVLGSATPSLESLHNAVHGRYQLLTLDDRAGNARPPQVRVLDVRDKPFNDGVSELLREAISQRLARREQVLLFVNRRGFSPLLICHACGWNADCQRCDAKLVLHLVPDRLRCHHCGADRPLPPRCEACGSEQLLAIGAGTERVSRALAEAFPGARIARIDRDSTRSRGSLSELLESVRQQEIDIVVGTQMIAKGHHFPAVTLVGVLDADGGLFGADFRSSERMAQLIVQVAGRAGRGDIPGEVVVQTHHPDHPLLATLLERGYREFASSALAERREAVLPPFASLALLRAEAAQREPVFEFLQQAKALAQEIPDVEGDPGGVVALGPVPAVMERRGGRYRAQLMLQSASRRALQHVLGPWLELLESLRAGRRVRWSLDVDPQETY